MNVTARGYLLQVHNPEGISVDKLLDTLRSAESMQGIAESFASTMPDWIRTSFFDPEMEK